MNVKLYEGDREVGAKHYPAGGGLPALTARAEVAKDPGGVEVVTFKFYRLTLEPGDEPRYVHEPTKVG